MHSQFSTTNKCRKRITHLDILVTLATAPVAPSPILPSIPHPEMLRKLAYADPVLANHMHGLVSRPSMACPSCHGIHSGSALTRHAHGS